MPSEKYEELSLHKILHVLYPFYIRLIYKYKI